ncbi:unnamed protein product [Closterium sp. NIES-54]
MYALSVSVEGDCYRCVPPDPDIAAAALGASESGTLPGTAVAEALHTFTLDSGASRCFFRDSTTLTPFPVPVPVRLADPSGGPVVARSSTVLPCPAVPSGSLSDLHLPSFSTNLGFDYFQTFSPTAKMTTLQVLMHVAAQRDYELHSLDFSTAFLQGSLHEEIWLCRPPGFTGTTTLAALGFTPSTADPSLFLRTDTSLPPFYGPRVLQRFGFLFSSPQPTPLSTSHLLSAPPSDESVESSGPYPELVGCIMYLMTCTRPDLAYPLSLLARYVAPGRHRKVHWDVAKRVLRYLCSTSGMGLVLRGRGPVVLTGHADASWVDDSATQRSSQGYTFSLDNKAMIALCQEHILEHRMKHIALRFFLARELQQRGQLRLAYVATRANTADVFTKALPLGVRSLLLC